MKPGEQWWELVAATLRQLRATRNLSQTDLEKRTGISQGLISRYERGAADPGIGKLLVLLEGMGFSLRQFADVLERTRGSATPKPREAKPASLPPRDPEPEARKEAYFLLRLTDEEARPARADEVRRVASMFDCLRDFFLTRVEPPRSVDETGDASGDGQKNKAHGS